MSTRSDIYIIYPRCTESRILLFLPSVLTITYLIIIHFFLYNTMSKDYVLSHTITQWTVGGYTEIAACAQQHVGMVHRRALHAS